MVTLPPYAQRFGMRLADAAGAPIIVLPFGPTVVGRPGYLHGGVIGGLLEVAALVALRHALGDAAVVAAPVTLTVDYRRGGRDAETRAAGVVQRLGGRIANVDATAWQDDPDRPIAAARLTFLLTR